MSVVVSAPGKAFLIGEYAVLRGAPAVVAAIGVRAVAHAPRAHLGETLPEPSPVVRGVREEFAALESATPLGDHPLVDTGRFHLGQRKLGLGSSAAVTAAVAGFHLAQAGRDPSDAATRDLALRLAQAGHRAAQRGGSGGDVAAAILGGVLRYQDGQASPIHLPKDLSVGFVDAGAPATTSAFVARVDEVEAERPEAIAAAMRPLGAAAEAFLAAIEGGQLRFEALREAVRQHVAGLRALMDATDLPILTPAIERILAQAEALGLAAKPTGAGGGDLVVVFADRPGALDHLAYRLREQDGIDLLAGLSVGAEGLRVEARPPTCSRLGGLYKLPPMERRDRIAQVTGLARERLDALEPGRFDLEAADAMIENVVGTLALPVGIATNFRINGRDVLVPMAVEEASVVAAASNAAKMIRAGGGFVAHADPPWMIGQIQLVRGSASDAAADVLRAITGAEQELLALADTAHPRLVRRGGGARAIEVRELAEDMVVAHVLVDCRDAMGANLINTIAEALAPRIEALTGWQACLRILSNLADRRLTHVRAHVPADALAGRGWDGQEVARLIASASRFAELDPYRATTHNKGSMNGADAVVLATGNDWRAMEASAHAYAAHAGRYAPLATWRVDEAGDLEGRITIPTALGTVGGATRTHPAASTALEILGQPDAATLGAVVACAGLASNLAALRALATEGIQRGHMSLHARAVALGAGAKGPEIDLLARRLVDVGEIKPERAESLLRELREAPPAAS